MFDSQDKARQNIISWCKEDNIPCIDVTDQNSQFAWTLTLGNVGHRITLYKNKQHNDRIYLQSQIAWNETHRTLVNQTWNEGQRNGMMFNLRKLAVQYGANMNFQLNGDELIGINTFKIHFGSLITKPELLEKYFRMESIHDILLNQLNIELGVALQNDKTNQKSGNMDTGR